MNNKTSIKIILDVIMCVLFLLLLDPNRTGLAFHEVAGLFILAIFSTHLFLNWSWVKNVTTRLIKAKSKPKFSYVLNLALLLGITVIAITGILISRVIFPSGSNDNQVFLSTIHKWSAYTCLGLLIIHVALHRKYVLVSMCNLPSRLGKTVTAFGASALIIGILYVQITPSSNKLPTQNSTQPGVTTRDSTNVQTQDNQNTSTLQETQGDGQTVSLSDFLGNMFCTGCSKHCSLLSLRCNKGEPQLQAAKAQYQNLYCNSSENL